MKKVLIAGYYGYQNSGDDAILHAICHDIEELSQEAEVMVLSHQPKMTEMEYKVKALDRFSFKSVINAMKKCDIFLMGGGNLLQDGTSSRSLYYYLGLIVLAKYYKKKIILYANGIGPIKKKYNKKITTWIINKVDMITLREHLSYEIIQEMNVYKPKIAVTADPVFNLKSSKVVSVEEIYRVNKIPTDKPLVGVLFRQWHYKAYYTEKIASICDHIVEKYGYNIVFIPMKHPADMVVCKDIASKMKQPSYQIKEHLHEDKMIAFIKDMRFILSMRLHGLIYGAMNKVPMIGFNYDPKVRHYINELNMQLVEDMSSINIQNVLEKIKQIEENYDVWVSVLEERVEALQEKALKNRVYLGELLDSNNNMEGSN